MNLEYYPSKQFKKGQVSQPIPHKKWTTVDGYDHINADVGGCCLPGSPEIKSMGYGLYAVEAALRITGTKKGKQMLVRFMRNKDTEPDDFATDEKTLTAGRNWKTHVYFVYLKPGDRISCQMWHDSGHRVKIEFAQFKMCLISPHDR